MIESRFVVVLLALGAHLTRTGERLVSKYGISQQQSVILIAVYGQGPVSQKEVRTALLYERSNVSKAVSILASMGLLKTKKSREDGRVVLLETTAKGKKIARACIDIYDEWNKAWLRGVPKGELGQSLKLLDRLIR